MLVKSNSSPDIQKINFAADLNETFHKIRDFEKNYPIMKTKAC